MSERPSAMCRNGSEAVAVHLDVSFAANAFCQPSLLQGHCNSLFAHKIALLQYFRKIEREKT